MFYFRVTHGAPNTRETKTTYISGVYCFYCGFNQFRFTGTHGDGKGLARRWSIEDETALFTPCLESEFNFVKEHPELGADIVEL